MDDSDGGGDAPVRLTAVFTRGDRKLYKVELRPGDTTIVSWKKLVREGNRQLHGFSSELPDSLLRVSSSAPGQPAQIFNNDAQPAHRFSSVIEKIERLYMGNDSSDEDDLRDVPRDNEYDTNDSFIDDTELDEYFKVDYSAAKHDGFFVNKGKLERTELPAEPQQQRTKRRRKGIGKAQGETDNNSVPNKRLKGTKTTAVKITASHEKNVHTSPQRSAVAVTVCEDKNLNRQQNAAKRNFNNIHLDDTTAVPSSIVVPYGYLSPSAAEKKDLCMEKTETSQLTNCSKKLRVAAGASDALHQISSEKTAVGRPLYSLNKQESSAQLRENNASTEQSHVGGKPGQPRENNSLIKQSDVDDTQHPLQVKSPHTQKKDASSTRLKSSMLEKAIRQLERMVAESRPPVMENQEANTSDQAIKRRLPQEIKQKLAKVARLAQASHGKISEELLNRLMGFLGHLMQLRTLKRNLKVMIDRGLSSKQKKNDKLKEMKKDLSEMIKVSLLDSKALNQQSVASDHKTDDKEAERRFCLDAALEDKICDLYDVYVDGLDEDARPLVRKLYTELAQLWPNNLVNNHGIKQAICNAKERRRAIHNGTKDQENNKREKEMSPREGTVQAKASLVALPQRVLERTSDGCRPICSSTSGNKKMPCMMLRSSPLKSCPSLDNLEQNSRRGLSGSILNAAKLMDNDSSKNKKKKKRKIELDRNPGRENSCTPKGGAAQISKAAYTSCP